MEMDLQINVRKHEEIPVIELSGEVDAYTSARFREIMLDIIDSDGVKLVISMNDVEYIDSSGLGALVGGLKRVSERDGKIVIICDKPQVKKVFEITGLEKVFPIYGTEEEAIAAVRS
ncbi:MAG: STAS domain-containing protein [Armatimonadetes bacterium]|nr:STAS domain-containing protein [Armatimonadota bacterium]